MKNVILIVAMALLSSCGVQSFFSSNMKDCTNPFDSTWKHVETELANNNLALENGFLFNVSRAGIEEDYYRFDIGGKYSDIARYQPDNFNAPETFTFVPDKDSTNYLFFHVSYEITNDTMLLFFSVPYEGIPGTSKYVLVKECR